MWVVHCHTGRKDLMTEIPHKKTAESIKKRHAEGNHDVSVYRVSLKGVIM